MIEFRDGFEFCHWNDIETNPKNSIKLFGFEFDNMYIQDNCKIFTGYVDDTYVHIIEADNFTDAVVLYLKFYTRNYKSYAYENALDERHGFSTENISSAIPVTESFYRDVKNIKLLRDCSFVKIDQCENFSKELNLYFETLRNSND